MNNLTKITTFGLPAIFGITLAWIGTRIISNERKLEERKMELLDQLNKQSI